MDKGHFSTVQNEFDSPTDLAIAYNSPSYSFPTHWKVLIGARGDSQRLRNLWDQVSLMHPNTVALFGNKHLVIHTLMIIKFIDSTSYWGAKELIFQHSSASHGACPGPGKDTLVWKLKSSELWASPNGFGSEISRDGFSYQKGTSEFHQKSPNFIPSGSLPVIWTTETINTAFSFIFRVSCWRSYILLHIFNKSKKRSTKHSKTVVLH